MKHKFLIGAALLIASPLAISGTFGVVECDDGLKYKEKFSYDDGSEVEVKADCKGYWLVDGSFPDGTDDVETGAVKARYFADGSNDSGADRDYRCTSTFEPSSDLTKTEKHKVECKAEDDEAGKAEVKVEIKYKKAKPEKEPKPEKGDDGEDDGDEA